MCHHIFKSRKIKSLYGSGSNTTYLIYCTFFSFSTKKKREWKERKRRKEKKHFMLVLWWRGEFFIQFSSFSFSLWKEKGNISHLCFIEYSDSSRRWRRKKLLFAKRQCRCGEGEKKGFSAFRAIYIRSSPTSCSFPWIKLFSDIFIIIYTLLLLPMNVILWEPFSFDYDEFSIRKQHPYLRVYLNLNFSSFFVLCIHIYITFFLLPPSSISAHKRKKATADISFSSSLLYSLLIHPQRFCSHFHFIIFLSSFFFTHTSFHIYIHPIYFHVHL